MRRSGHGLLPRRQSYRPAPSRPSPFLHTTSRLHCIPARNFPLHHSTLQHNLHMYRCISMTTIHMIHREREMWVMKLYKAVVIVSPTVLTRMGDVRMP